MSGPIPRAPGGPRRRPTPREGESVRCRVGGPGPGGWFHALADDGSALRVAGAAPGDRLLVSGRRGDDRAWARPLAVLEAGAGRREAPCRHAHRCGGCHWLHLDAATQDDLKQAAVHRALASAGTALHADWRPAEPRLGYRCRARLQAGLAGGRFHLGFHEVGGPRVVDTPSCPLFRPELQAVVATLRRELAARPPADLTGLEVTALPGAPGALVTLNPRDRPPAGWRDLAARLLARPEVAGVSAQGAPGAILGAPSIVGRAPGGQPVAAAARGFVQAHLAMAERLAGEVVRLSRHAGRHRLRVLELHAGSGLLSWALAEAGHDVVAIERDRQAVAAAGRLPPPRGALHVVCGTVADALGALSAAPDLIACDPPRSGLGDLAVGLAALAVPVIGVWCSLDALARDVAVLARTHVPTAAVALDLFPQTRHVETAVALLPR